MSDPLPTVSSRLRHLAEHNADRPMVACGGDWRGAGVVAGQAQRLAAGLLTTWGYNRVTGSHR